ncbi:MAG: hypothetical protein ACFB21_15575 [Opitutales bacterium]
MRLPQNGQTLAFQINTIIFLATDSPNTLNGNDSFNPQAIQTFSGSLFLTDSSGNLLSGVVPGPAAIAGLFGLAALLIARRRV